MASTYYAALLASITSSGPTAPVLRAETIAYKNRVEADGGAVQNLAAVNGAYQLKADKGLAAFYWVSALFGLKIQDGNKLAKMYCLFGNDLTSATVGHALPTFSGGVISMISDSRLSVTNRNNFDVNLIGGSLQTFVVANPTGTNSTFYAKSVPADSPGRYFMLNEAGQYTAFQGLVAVPAILDQWQTLGHSMNPATTTSTLFRNGLAVASGSYTPFGSFPSYDMFFFHYPNSNNVDSLQGYGYSGGFKEMLFLSSIPTQAVQDSVWAVMQSRF